MFNTRSHTKEILDSEDIPADELKRNLAELHSINRYLGGYAVSLNALKEVLGKNKSGVLVDIGCGGGDTLRELKQWSSRQRYDLKLHGIDIKEECIRYSVSGSTGDASLNFICDDYRRVLTHVPDANIIHASLFCHHLGEAEIRELIAFALNNRITLVINDLERNPIAYFSISLLTRLFSRSRLVKNDAPLSVLRGFRKKEWKELLTAAGAVNYSIKNKWAFRHQIIVYHE